MMGAQRPSSKDTIIIIIIKSVIVIIIIITTRIILTIRVISITSNPTPPHDNLPLNIQTGSLNEADRAEVHITANRGQFQTFVLTYVSSAGWDSLCEDILDRKDKITECCPDCLNHT